ncbi:VF530 family DNA-binding protein [Shewanella intestini]|uniref:DNA-binding protein VF530 n=1 Tax=Shewanella intestini TaxID=2017544 RepID=A0ABS5I4M6_9GAMM|nr:MULTISPECIES: VF530 family DNA-binding protein [Shewanella]MBR9728983.1 DNA-binding protein VF530 [Shewanella intestini]MRG36951.1 DNA-binding protein VF530 [Shewanella sp. XMDDZSB0408]
MIEQQQNNPLHGLGLEKMVTELVEFYDWKVLYAALRLECFNLNPSMPACLKFLKKTEWARERVESFYLYRFKRMPKGSATQFELKPRERGFAEGILPRKPEPLTVELVAQMREKAAADYQDMKKNNRSKPQYGKDKPRAQDSYAQNRIANKNRKKASQDPTNPWGK